MFSQEDQQWMARCMALAKRAEDAGEVPVGACIVRDGELLAEGFNQPISRADPTAHAEIVALRAACQHAQNYRLPNSTLYVTLEPCSMCAGALVHSRIERVVIATAEPRAGAAGSVVNLLENPSFNHQCSVEFGLLQEQSADLLKSFFKSRR